MRATGILRKYRILREVREYVTNRIVPRHFRRPILIDPCDEMGELLDEQSWLGEFGQRGNWSFCLPAAKMAAEQERT